MRTLSGLLVMTVVSIPAAAQQIPADQFPLSSEVKAVADMDVPAGTEFDDALAELRDNLWKAVYLKAGEAQVAEILESRRADIQVGASSGTNGTTSAVSSPLLPAIFGVGVENGALTRTVSGTTVTLALNPAGLICASDPSVSALVAVRDNDVCRTFFRRVGATVAFDASRGAKSAELKNLETLDQQFAEFTLRVELLNRRKATDAAYRTQFAQTFRDWQSKAEAFSTSDRRTTEIERAEELLVERMRAYAKSEQWRAANPEKRRQTITALVREVAARTSVPAAHAAAVRQTWLNALQADRALALAVANGPLLTFEYGFQRPDLAAEAIGDIVAAGVRPPNLHTARLIYAQGIPGRRIDLTANLSSSLFHDTRPGMRGRLRDVRSGVEAGWRLRDFGTYGAPTLTIAGLYVYLHQEPLGLGLTAFNQAKIDERGNIWLFQAKLELPTGNNAVRIPLSLTYSNRTELIKEEELRGQFGISFNLDALFAQ